MTDAVRNGIFGSYEARYVETEEGGSPRIPKLQKALNGKPQAGRGGLNAMLNALPRNGPKVFGGALQMAHRVNFQYQRIELARKLQNPRLLKISFHTLCHWKATIEYYKTKAIPHVQQLLGHRSVESTMVYTHLYTVERDDYHVKTAKTPTEACDLAEADFAYSRRSKESRFFGNPRRAVCRFQK